MEQQEEETNTEPINLVVLVRLRFLEEEESWWS